MSSMGLALLPLFREQLPVGNNVHSPRDNLTNEERHVEEAEDVLTRYGFISTRSHVNKVSNLKTEFNCINPILYRLCTYEGKQFRLNIQGKSPLNSNISLGSYSELGRKTREGFPSLV